MIQSADLARKITDPNGTFPKDDPMYLEAKGYLGGLAGPETKALHFTIDRLNKEVIEWQERYKALFDEQQKLRERLVENEA